MNSLTATFNSTDNSITLVIHCTNVIKNIYIDNQYTFNCGESNSTSAWHLEVADYIWNEYSSQDEETGEYTFTYTIYLNDIEPNHIVTPTAYDKWSNASVNTDLFFIYVDYDGQWYQDLYIEYDEDTLRNSIFNALYDAIDSKKCCAVNTSIIDKLLLYDAFKLVTSNKDKVYFWNLLHMTNVDTNSNCSCNG